MTFWRFSFIFFGAWVLLLPLVVGAQGFVSMNGSGLMELPGFGQIQDTQTFVQALYDMAIWIAAFLAVLKIIGAGAKYMFTEVVPTKEAAKKDIQGAIVGLLIVLSAVLILNTINRDLTELNIFRNVPTPIGPASSDSGQIDPCQNIDPNRIVSRGVDPCSFRPDPGDTVRYIDCNDTNPGCTGRGCALRYDCSAAEIECAEAGGTGVKSSSRLRCDIPSS